jgi:putative tryptophan/tyrosine transport system substrate-binding protein
MRRRDVTAGLLLAASAQSLRAQEPAKQRRIAIVIPAGPITSISNTGPRARQAFFEELRRAGDIEEQNLSIDRYSGEGRPEGYADLVLEVISCNREVIVASNDAIAKAARAATGTIPIVWIGGDRVQAGLAMSLARPGGNITGVTVYAGYEIWGKRLQSSMRRSRSIQGRLPDHSCFTGCRGTTAPQSRPAIANLAHRVAARRSDSDGNTACIR